MFTRFIRSVLAAAGLLDVIQGRRRANRIHAILKKYPHDNLTVVVGEHRIAIPTPTWYTKHWFSTRCANGHPHEPSVTRLLMQAAAKSTCFVDVGAHVGYFTVVAAQVMASVNIWAFEMDPFHTNELNAVIGKHPKAGDIHVVNAAVSDKSGTMNVSTRVEGHPGIGIRDHTDADVGSIDAKTVPVVTLTEYFGQLNVEPDLYKIDVEGAEHLVLSGMDMELGLERATIFLEVHPSKIRRYGSTIVDVMARIAALGFQAHEIRGLRSTSIDAEIVPVTDASLLTENTMLLLTQKS